MKQCCKNINEIRNLAPRIRRNAIESFDSEDFKEGVAHYVEKRAPKFTGK